MKRILVPVVLSTISLLVTASLGAEPSPSKLVLAGQPPAALDLLDPEELNLRWNTFEHIPFEDSGFSHLTLPFLFVSHDGAGAQEEALAFSFLISNAMDWGRGCYCARHAYFCFKRAREDMEAMTNGYDRSVIKKLAEGWAATVVVGGELHTHTNGFSGVLEIFSQSGASVLKKEYKTPIDYFELLGAMSADALAFTGDKPSPALVQHLKMKRCKDHESIIDLGRAAFAEERSDYEFGLYRNILARDAGFAEVRYWYGNQNAWHTDNWDEYRSEKLKALRSYITESALSDTAYGSLKTPQEKQEFVGWVNDAAKLIGEDSPQVASLRFDIAVANRRVTKTLFEDSLKTAGQYPNSFGLLVDLHNAAEEMGDASLSGSLAFASLVSPFKPGSSKATRNMAGKAAVSMLTLGHPRDAVMPASIAAEIAGRDPKYAEYYFGQFAQTLWEAGEFDGALQMSAAAAMSTEDKTKKRDHFVRAGMAAFLAGNEVAMPELRKAADQSLALTDVNKRCDMTPTDAFAVYEFLSQGKVEEARAQIKNRKPFNGEHITRFAEVDYLALLARIELDLAQKKSELRLPLERVLRMFPNRRSLWILYDAYDRLSPTREAGMFYEVLGWLHRDDRWVQSALTARSQRMPEKPVIDLKTAQGMFADYEARPWPAIGARKPKSGVISPFEYYQTNSVQYYATNALGQVTLPKTPQGKPRPVYGETQPSTYAYAIKLLMDSKDYDGSEKLALQCATAAEAHGSRELQAQYLRIYHRIRNRERL